jgi:hypothetical protein
VVVSVVVPGYVAGGASVPGSPEEGGVVASYGEELDGITEVVGAEGGPYPPGLCMGDWDAGLTASVDDLEPHSPKPSWQPAPQCSSTLPHHPLELYNRGC